MQQSEAHCIPKCSFSTFLVYALIFVEKGVDAIPQLASQFTLETILGIVLQRIKLRNSTSHIPPQPRSIGWRAAGEPVGKFNGSETEGKNPLTSQRGRTGVSEVN